MDQVDFTLANFLVLDLFCFRLPPFATLFPYTTLFRSDSAVAAAVSGGSDSVALAHALSQLAGDGGCRFAGIDRKSTRLNSSHTVISYAVFCLKKKKRTLHDL